MKTNIFIIAMIIVLGIASHYGFYELGKSKAEIKHIRDTDTVTTFIEIIDTVIIPKFTVKTKTDTVINNLTDTVFIDQTEYIASFDSTYEDDKASLSVAFISPIPLSTKSFFDIDLKVKSELVFVPTYVQDESFWHNRFGFFFGGGAVYTQAGVADLGLFLGFGVRLN
jgi:hypothetical protein